MQTEETGLCRGGRQLVADHAADQETERVRRWLRAAREILFTRKRLNEIYHMSRAGPGSR
jgi:hypothetical protein